MNTKNITIVFTILKELILLIKMVLEEWDKEDETKIQNLDK
jgi:hypothetical protein